jgi:serine/threonine protein kinase
LIAQRICPECQTSNPPQAAFCFGCGKALKQVAVEPELLHQRYHLLHQLGIGGFGAVYQAEDIQLGKRLVAIKEMSSQSNLSAQQNAEAAEAFKQEAFMLAELMQPNLPRIYDHFNEGGRWYLVMDYIEGTTLEEYLAQTPGGHLPLQEVLEMGLQLCDVLEYLHTRQPPIIFRDLKPLNMMRTSSGHLYLIDFGIARHFKPGQAKDTIAFGSPGYAAPEQYGKTQTTPRSDIYSLGATLHQLLTGVDPSLHPFRFSPLRLPGGKPTPGALAVLLARMLEMDETMRPSSMSVVKAELRTIAASIAGESFVSIKPMPIAQPAAVTVKKPVQASPQIPTAQPAAVTVKKSVQTPPRPVKSLSREALHTRHDSKGRSVRSIAWSPDSTLLASAGESNVVDVWNAENGNTVRTYQEHQENIRAVAWSPDGTYIASSGEDRTVQVWSAASGICALIYQGHTHIVTGLAWSPDSQYIASCSLDRSVQIWSREKGSVAVIYEQHKDIVYRVAWSPDGKYVASTGYGGSVRIWEALSGRDLLAHSGEEEQALALNWSPDGKLLASGGSGASLQVWEAMSGRVVQTCSGTSAQILSLSWSPDGKYLVSGGAKDKVLIWDVGTGQQSFVYVGHKLPPDPSTTSAYTYGYPSTQFVQPHVEISAVAWSPNGNWIVSGDTLGSMHVWAVN